MPCGMRVMDSKRFFRVVRNPRHISGVHNYCDRWCERCPLTLRCSVFAVDAEMAVAGEAHDREKELLWPRLEGARGLAEEMIAAHKDHAGVGLLKVRKFDRLRESLDKNRLGAAAKRYMEFAH